MRLIVHNHLPQRRTHDQGRSALAQGPGRVEVVELPQSSGKPTLYGAHIYGAGFGGYVLGHGYKSREEAKRDGERFLKQHGETDDAARTSLKAGDRVKHFVSGDLGTIGSFASGYAVVTWDRGGTSLVAPEILVGVGTGDAKGDTVQIVYARAEETALEPTGRYVERDRNLFPEFKVTWEGKAGLWKHEGTQEDVQKAKAWAAGEGYEVFTYPMSESDPKGRAKAAVVAKAKRR